MSNPLYVPGPDSVYQSGTVEPAGFLDGLWHGFVAAVVFIASLFNEGVRIYETENEGRWYDLGFLVGIGAQLPGVYILGTFKLL